MNDRIKELAEQARKKPLGDSWCYATPAEFEEKFAELIIRECALAGLETHGNYDVHDDILKHFGVAE